MKALFSFVLTALPLLMVTEISAAQYRADDEVHAGHQKYDDPKTDALRVTVPAREGDHTEELTLSFAAPDG